MTAGLRTLVARYPEVQLATLVTEPPDGREWLHEQKYDGYRLLGYLSGGEVYLRTRNGQDWTSRFPAIAAGLRTLKAKAAVLDMEAVALDSRGISSFQTLQGALHTSDNGAPVIAYAFDLLHENGADWSQRPLLERRQELTTLLRRSKPLRAIVLSQEVKGQGPKVASQACRLGLEGLISKPVNGAYHPGRHSGGWLKFKCLKRQEFIILGFRRSTAGARSLGALYLGYRDGSHFRYAGKAGTGFTIESAAQLIARLGKIRKAQPALPWTAMPGLQYAEWRGIQWVRPDLVCEVAFTEWTDDGKVRHPSFQGLREDKEAAQVTKEIPGGAGGGKLAGGVKITHPDRIIAGDGHITKGQLADYYALAAPMLLPLIAGRPISLLRCPEGVDGECFYQRSPGRGLGGNVHPFAVSHKGKKYEYLYVDDVKGLLEIVQMGSIEIHPWGSTIRDIEHPDRMIFDLDPAPGLPFEAVKLAARDLRRRLQAHGMEPTVLCTGGKGLHVIVRLAGEDTWADVKAFAGRIAGEMVEAVPDAYVATMSKAKRHGKIFVDYFRNDFASTAVAPFSVRARPGAPVAMPVSWRELASLKSASAFDIGKAQKRIRKLKPEIYLGPIARLPR